jgi:hypothetical protein
MIDPRIIQMLITQGLLTKPPEPEPLLGKRVSDVVKVDNRPTNDPNVRRKTPSTIGVRG